MIYVQWERPRKWAVRMYGPRPGIGYHKTIGVVALSIDRAIEAAQKLHPDSRVESVNDTGEVHIVVDSPLVGQGFIP